MNISKYFKSRSYGRQLLFVLMALFLAFGLVFTKAPEPVLAWPPAPIDEDPIIPPPPYTPPANGFVWSVPPRYGWDRNHDGVIDSNYIASTYNYDKGYIYPNNYPMDLNGCQTAADFVEGFSTTNNYYWNINGTIFNGGYCEVHYTSFTQEGNYPVSLTYTPQGGTAVTFTQQVYIKDYFIVALGDSIASGEGNPDVPQKFDANGNVSSAPVWQDKRCHRSGNAYPSKAALALEQSDPHTSVTFISYACSGATILTDLWDPKLISFSNSIVSFDLSPDPNKHHGIGIFGPTIGNDPVPYNTPMIPAQWDQLKSTLIPPEGKTERQIDALVISAGGNDLKLADMAMTCLLYNNCWPSIPIWENFTPYMMQQFAWRALHKNIDGGSTTSLPDGYARLNNEILNLDHDVRPAKVYLSQYPDWTRGTTYGTYCNMLNDIFPGTSFAVSGQESQQLSYSVISGLNQAVKDAASLYGWQLVDGISSYVVDPAQPAYTPGLFVKDANNQGHGYCASDYWIVRASDSERMQGPYPLQRHANKGTEHPNFKGTQVYKDRLLYYMRPNLGVQSLGEPSVLFTTEPASQGLTNTAGANGWYTGACDSDKNCYPQVVLQAVAKSTIPLKDVGVSVNGEVDCSLLSATCSPTVVSSQEVRWDFTFTTDGIYQIQLSAQDSEGRITDYETEVKVDLHDPIFNPLPGPFEVDEGSKISLSAQASDFNTTIPDVDWDLDNDGVFETTDDLPVFSAADLVGPASQPVGVRATDEAGRSTIATATIDIQDLAPLVSISAPAYGTLYALNAEVSLSASFTGASACWVDWMDGNKETVACGSGASTASHAYPAAGVYLVQVTAADERGWDTEPLMVVVYDPSAGFVTGGGWIDSPAGAYKADEALAGKAAFGFVSKYQKGASVPTGNTAFEFDLAGLTFSSQSYEWLVVNKAGTNAQFKGSGLINGTADSNGNAYKFMLWAGDGFPDTFRIRIWWEDANGEHDVYDNGVDQAIGGGSIVLHTNK